MKILVTGATGRVGSLFLETAPGDMNPEVLVEPTEQHVPDLPWYRTDITNRERLMRTIQCAAPDVVVHLAAMTNVDGCERDPDTAYLVNRDGTANIADACADVGASLLFMSTDYVFDGRHGPYVETDTPHPVSVYGASKLAGEEAVAASGIPASILRISVPFGVRRPGVGHNFVTWLMEALEGEEELRIVTDQYTTPAYIDELTELMWDMIREGYTGTLHYGTHDRLSRMDMARQVCMVMDLPGDRLVPVTTAELGLLAERPLESGFVTGEVHGVLGRQPVLFETALFRMIEAMH